MDPGGTRSGKQWWTDTSTKQLMKGEAYAFRYVSQFADDLQGYFVPITVDQRYPDSISKSEDDEEDEVKQDDEPKVDPEEKVRIRNCICPCKRLPFCGRSVKYRTKEYIMTYEFGDKNTMPTIVMLHGFAGSALLYYPLFELLAGRYHVLAIDLLGMGSSSRPEFMANTTREATLFFIESIEEWRKEMDIDNMTLVCHSLGSYIGMKYAYDYPEHVKKLVLLSPLGLHKDHTGTAGTFRRADTDAQPIRKYIYMLARFLLNNNGSPMDVTRILGKRISAWLIDDYTTRRLRMTEYDKQELFPYMYQMGLSGRSGELALGKIIELSLSAYEPTMEELLELIEGGIKVVIGFGETDFCNTKFKGEPVSEELIEHGISVTIIEGATHQVFFDKPVECVEIIDSLCLED